MHKINVCFSQAVLTLPHAAHIEASGTQPQQHPRVLPSVSTLASGSHGLHIDFLGIWDFSLPVASVLAALSTLVYVPTAVQFADFYCKYFVQYYYSTIKYSVQRIRRLLCGASELFCRMGRFF